MTSSPTSGLAMPFGAEHGSQVGLLFSGVMSPPLKPSPCRVHAFIAGQNLFHSVRRILGYSFPNYDLLRLAQAITALTPDRQLTQVHFYTGMPSLSQDCLGRSMGPGFDI